MVVVSMDLSGAADALFSLLLFTTPFWGGYGFLQTAYLDDKDERTLIHPRYVKTFCMGCVASLPFTLIYTLAKRLFFKDVSAFTAFLPLIPIFSYYGARLTTGRLLENNKLSFLKTK